MGQPDGLENPISGHQLDVNAKGDNLVNVPKAAKKKKKKAEGDGYAKPDRWPNRQFRRQYVTMPRNLPFMMNKSVTDMDKTWCGKVRENQEKGIRFNNAFFQNLDNDVNAQNNAKADSIRKHMIEFYNGDTAKAEAVISENDRLKAIRYDKKLSGNQSTFKKLSKSKRKIMYQAYGN